MALAATVTPVAFFIASNWLEFIVRRRIVEEAATAAARVLVGPTAAIDPVPGTDILEGAFGGI